MGSNIGCGVGPTSGVGSCCQQVTIVCAGMFSNHLIRSFKSRPTNNTTGDDDNGADSKNFHMICNRCPKTMQSIFNADIQDIMNWLPDTRGN